LLKRKDNAEDRNKEISTLLKENLNFEYKDERQRKVEEREKKYKESLDKRQKERERIKQKQLEEKQKREQERAQAIEKKKAEKAQQQKQQTNNNKYVAIHEAALYNYGSMTLRLNMDKHLQTDITPLSDGMKAYVDLPFNSPWRVIMIADSAIELTVNRMILNLNNPPKDDFSWVKPLKFLGIWWAMYVGEWTWAEGKKHGASTEHAKQYLEWCLKLGVSGLLIEGWNNGWSGEWSMNGKFTDYLHPVADFNMEEVSEKARECDIDLIAQHETVGQIDNYERQLESAFSYLVSNGIHYVKTGYTGSKMLIAGKQEFHHSQLGVLHYQKTVELAVRYQIMLNIHEPIKGTGIERTYPNILYA